MASSAAGFAIVTGANTGLGLHFVKSLYASGTYSAIVLACRSEQRAKSAIEQICCGQSSPAENGNGTQTKLEFAKLDLTCNDSVRTFVSQLDERPYQKGSLRLLVNNAGIMGHPFQLVDGVEVHFASNHLGHFLLTNLLIKHNWLASDARILLVTSGLYEKCHSMLTAAELTTNAVAKKRSPAEYYAFSKLANCLHAVGLANRLASPAVACSFRDVKVVAIRPGFVRGTELGRHTNFLLRMLAYPLIWMVAKNLDQIIPFKITLQMSQQSQAVVERSPTPDSELNELSAWYEILEDDDDNILHWFTPKKARDVCQEVLEFAQERGMPCEKLTKWMKILNKICAPRLEQSK